MMPEVHRERSGCELVFGLLKTLMTGYRLWGIASGVELALLADFLRASEARVTSLVVYLTAEGLVSVDCGTGTVRLTENGAHDLLSDLQGRPPDDDAN